MDAALDTTALLTALHQRLDRIELLLGERARPEPTHYTIAEAAQVLGKVDYTVREWARTGRIRAEKRRSGRGRYQEWVVSREEIERYRREGLLPLAEHRPDGGR